MSNDPTPSEGPGEPAEPQDLVFDQTSLRVRRAIDGDRASVEWVIERFGPALTEQARYRMPRLLRAVYSIDDVVQDVWISVLPRLGTIESRGSGMTRALLRYFSTALVNRINDLARRHARGQRLERTESGKSHLSRLISETTGVRSRVHRTEAAQLLRDTLEAMQPLDREVLILRGIEQHSNQEAAELVGESADTVSHRYQRALEKLRTRLPNTFFDDM